MFDLCGYVEKETKQVRIPFEYEGTEPFSEGLAGVGIGGKFGFIDAQGNVVIPPRFEGVGSFEHGLAEVRLNGKSGLINRKGEIVVEPRFAQAIVFNAETALVREGDDAYWRPGSLFIFDPLRALSIPTGRLSDDEYEFKEFDKQGRYIWASRPGEDSFGLMRPDGSWKIPPRFWMAQSMWDERAIVCVGPNSSPKQECGAVDPEGKMVVPLRKWFLHYWRNGIGIAKIDGKQALLDKAGNLVGGRTFDQVDPAWKGDVSKVLLNGTWVGLHRNGQIVANPDDGKIAAECPDGLKFAHKGGKFQLLGKDGKELISTPIDEFSTAKITMSLDETGSETIYELDCDRPNWIKSGSNYGLVDVSGTVTNLSGVTEIGQFSLDGKAPARFGRKWGLIDSSGKTVLAAHYDQLSQIDDESYRVRIGDRRFVIDPFGKEKPEPAGAVPRDGYRFCPGGAKYVSAEAGGTTLWGLADEKNNVIIEPKYRAVRCYQEGIAWVTVDAKKKWCPVDRSGQLTDGKCGEATYPYYQTHAQPEKFSDEPYENSVLWTRAFLDFGAGRRASPPVFKMDGTYPSTSTFR